MWSTIAPVAITAAVTLLGAWLGLRGTRTLDRTSSLDKAAGWWQQRGDKLETDVADLKAAMRELEAARVEDQDRMTRLEKTSSLYRRVITEVVQWLTELLEWEAKGSVPPPPAMSLTMILAHLTAALRDDHD